MRWLQFLGLLCASLLALLMGLGGYGISILPGRDIGLTVSTGNDWCGEYARFGQNAGDLECVLAFQSPGLRSARYVTAFCGGQRLTVSIRDDGVRLGTAAADNQVGRFTWTAGEPVTVYSWGGSYEPVRVTDWVVYLKDGPAESLNDRRSRRTIQVVLIALAVIGAGVTVAERIAAVKSPSPPPPPPDSRGDPEAVVESVIETVRAGEDERHPHTAAYRLYLKELLLRQAGDGGQVMANLLPDESDVVRFAARNAAINDFNRRMELWKTDLDRIVLRAAN